MRHILVVQVLMKQLFIILAILLQTIKHLIISLLEGLARFGKVTGFTATPLFEHRGLLPEKIQNWINKITKQNEGEFKDKI